LAKETKETKSKVVDDKSKVNSKREFFVPRNQFSKSYVHPIWTRNNNFSSIGKAYKNSEIDKMLLNPYMNYKELQNVSNYLWQTSPFYQNIIYYLSTLITFDGVLAPNSVTDVVNNASALEKRLLGSALTVKKIDVKNTFPSMMIRTLVNGETYWYDLSTDKEGATVIEEIPSKYCKLAYIDNITGLWRYFVDLSLIDSELILELPEEIIKAYKKYIKLDRSKQKEKILHPDLNIEIPNNLHLIGDNGFAIFVHKEKSHHDYPFLASMFTDINTLENNKEYMDEYLKDSNVKLLHQKIPIDKETGEPLFEKDMIDVFHQSAKEHLPSSTAPLTNPFEVEALNFDGVQDSALSVAKNSKEMVQFDSGISSTIFDANTTNGLGYSIEADASKIYPLLSYFTNWVNFKIKPYKFSVTFLQIHRHNREAWHKQYATDLLNGGQRSLFMATNGLDLYDSIMISKMERLLEFDDWLPCKMNASQMGSQDLDKVNHRPEKEDRDKADGTVRSEDYK
jgi:hypothetical protein